MSEPQDPQDPTPDVSPDLKMPEVPARKPDIRFFRKGLDRTPEPETPEPAVERLAKPTKHMLMAMREERRQKAYQLWLNNVPIREIARQLGISPSAAWRAMEAYRLAERQRKSLSIDRIRDKQQEQLEAIGRRALVIADSSTSSGQVKVMALAEVTKTIEIAAKLTGTNMPTKIASTTPDGKSWAPVAVGQLTAQFSVEELKVLERAARMELLPAHETPIINAEVVEGEKTGTE